MDVYALDVFFFFFFMIRRPPRSTLDRSSAASDVYKRQELGATPIDAATVLLALDGHYIETLDRSAQGLEASFAAEFRTALFAVSYTHLRAHETVLDLVCRLLLEKKKTKKITKKKKRKIKTKAKTYNCISLTAQLTNQLAH